MTKPAALIDHIALVLDRSPSIRPVQNDVVKVADAQIAYLQRRSKELGREIRISIYTFASDVTCEIFDTDVLRLTSVRDVYSLQGGMTALIDATLKSQDDLSKTAQLYGDHAFLTFVLTDGGENDSRRRVDELQSMFARMAENWTVAVLVPGQREKFAAKSYGFPADNIAIWDATSAAGIEEGGRVIREATESFITSRTSGVRGTRSLFSTGIDAVNPDTVRATLRPLALDRYHLIPVHETGPIREYIQSRGLVFVLGKAYYQWTKTEDIQAGKGIAVVEKDTGKVFMGPDARGLLGLSTISTERLRPDQNPKFDVYVQSTAVNRKLLEGTKVLVLR